jgi:hypothetical protein
MSKEFKINLLKEMDLLYAKIHRLEDVCEQANIMLNQRDEIEEGLNKRIAELEAENDQLTAHYATERQDDKWIPVSERLPEANKCVLVYDAGGNMTVDFLVTSGEVEKYFWLAKYRILFWMPLPESPNDTQTQTIVYGKESEE